MTETWRSVNRLERADFYADWLAAGERNAVEVGRSPIVARGRELTWIETPNEHRIAMLIGEQVGFPTNGTNLCRVVVPAGEHTGRHRHGEEAIHVLAGEGCILVGGRRYDVRDGNDDPRPVLRGPPGLQPRWRRARVSSRPHTMDLDLFVRLGRLEQLEEKGPNDAARWPRCRPRTASSTRWAGGSPSISRTPRTRARAIAAGRRLTSDGARAATATTMRRRISPPPRRIGPPSRPARPGCRSGSSRAPAVIATARSTT